MAITPNYSWPLPDDTSLVKEGAEAIRDLGNAIDNTVDGLPSGGLVHIVQTTWSGVASVNVDDCFTSTFRNYRIIGTITSPTGNAFLNMRLRASASNFSGANHNRSFFTFGAASANASTTGQTSFVQIGEVRSTVSDDSYSISVDVFKPQLSVKTNILAQYIGINTAGADISRVYGGLLANTFAADGFSWLVASGNFSGTLSVYGYKD